MAVTIKPRRTVTAGAVPTTANLADGEMAINTTDKKIYVRVGSSIVEVANSAPSNSYIDGCNMEWVSGTSVRLGTGAAYVPSTSGLVRVTTALTVSLTPANNTWYHLYLYANAGVAAAELVTTAPSATYYGTARTKTGDTSRRYIGSVRSGASGGFIKFMHNATSGAVDYLADINNTALYVLAGGTASTETSVSLATALPVTSRTARVFAERQGAGEGTIILSNGDVTAGSVLFFVRNSGQVASVIPVTSSQTITYFISNGAGGTSGNTHIWCAGYMYER